MDFSAIGIAVTVAVASACVAEAANWFMIYRHAEYKKLTADIASQQKNVDAMKAKFTLSAATQTPAQQKASDRKLKAFELGLQTQQNVLVGKKSRGMLITALLSIFVIRTMYANFQGQVVARLPFTPVSMVSGLTHYGLEGDDMTECSMTFLFVLCNLTFGNYTKKLLSLEGERVNLPQLGG